MQYLVKLKGLKHGWKCKKCRKRARHLIYGVPYCKRCSKRVRKVIAAERALKKTSNKFSFEAKQKTITERIKNLRRRATPAEKCFKEKLEQICPVQFRFQRGFIKHGYYAIVDFHLPARNICIEIDGGYHDNPEQRKKDDHRDKWLTNVRRQRVIRITNERAFEITLDEILDMIALPLKNKQKASLISTDNK